MNNTVIAHPVFCDSVSYMESCEAFPWEEWRQHAISQGVSESLAELGSRMIRLCYERKWETLKDSCGWTDSGFTMLWLVKTSPEFARRFWTRIIDTDGYRIETPQEPGRVA